MKRAESLLQNSKFKADDYPMGLSVPTLILRFRVLYIETIIRTEVCLLLFFDSSTPKYKWLEDLFWPEWSANIWCCTLLGSACRFICVIYMGWMSNGALSYIFYIWIFQGFDYVKCISERYVRKFPYICTHFVNQRSLHYFLFVLQGNQSITCTKVYKI